jgi:hypothetical protein
MCCLTFTKQVDRVGLRAVESFFREMRTEIKAFEWENHVNETCYHSNVSSSTLK